MKHENKQRFNSHLREREKLGVFFFWLVGLGCGLFFLVWFIPSSVHRFQLHRDHSFPGPVDIRTLHGLAWVWPDTQDWCDPNAKPILCPVSLTCEQVWEGLGTHWRTWGHGLLTGVVCFWVWDCYLSSALTSLRPTAALCVHPTIQREVHCQKPNMCTEQCIRVRSWVVGLDSPHFRSLHSRCLHVDSHWAFQAARRNKRFYYAIRLLCFNHLL